MSGKQLVLPIQAQADKSFDNFVVGANQQVVDALESVSQSDGSAQFVYLYGSVGTGKTHLLLAQYRALSSSAHKSVYVDLQKEYQQQHAQLVLVDHLEAISGDLPAQERLLTALERVRNESGRCVLAGNMPVASLKIELPDLLSRIKSFPAHQLIELGDEDKRRALILMAKTMGFNLPAEVARWMLVHQSRDLHQLSALLERIDTLSLEQNRKITIPLIKTLA